MGDTTREQIEEACLATDPFQGDDTDFLLLSDKFVFVRCEHVCIVCQGRIKKGERCRARTERSNEERKIMTFYFCPICCRAEAKAEDDDSNAIIRRYDLGKSRIARRQKSRQSSEVPS